MDGFNLYHAIADLKNDHLKWVNLWALMEKFVDLKSQGLVAVYYCSAYATWLDAAYARHRRFVAAQRACGVTTIMGKFKEKPRRCFRCHETWVAHEEKESDVNIAIRMVQEAYRDSYDVGMLVTADSDIAPAVRLVRTEFPDKRLRILAPPGRRHSKELTSAAGGKGRVAKIKKVHLERSLLPEHVRDHTGKVVAVRPAKYAPPVAAKAAPVA